jgi:hypothetical protein
MSTTRLRRELWASSPLAWLTAEYPTPNSAAISLCGTPQVALSSFYQDCLK